jgi:uncharacterized membrane protein YczE
MLPLPPRAELWRRLPRLFAGLVLFGVAIGCLVRADLGLPPWDVLHQGVSEHTGLAMGTASIFVGVAVLLLWLPLRERVGLGTVANALIVGLVIDVTMAVLDTPASMAARVGLLVVGIALFGPGSGLYIGAGLGPGPRDGLMTALARRGRSVRTVRTAIELAVLVIGFVLGGSVGIGTVVFAVTVGPNVHLFLDRMTIAPRPAPVPETLEARYQGRLPSP